MNTLLNFPPPREVIYFSVFPDVAVYQDNAPEHIEGGETEKLPHETMTSLVFG